MSVAATTTAAPTNVTVVAEKTPFYKTFSFWVIFISIIILIVIGFIIFFEAGTPTGGFVLIGFYVFAIIFLIIGVLIAVV